jgi:hypothetical protein
LGDPWHCHTVQLERVAIVAFAKSISPDRGRAKLNGINPQRSRLLPTADYPRHLAAPNLKLVILDAECAVA